MNEIITRIVELPTTVKGAVAQDANGDYNIYINSRLSIAEQFEAFEHELEHIGLGHFTDNKEVMVKEQEVRYAMAEKAKSTIY